MDVGRGRGSEIVILNCHLTNYEMIQHAYAMGGTKLESTVLVLSTIFASETQSFGTGYGAVSTHISFYLPVLRI